MPRLPTVYQQRCYHRHFYVALARAVFLLFAAVAPLRYNAKGSTCLFDFHFEISPCLPSPLRRCELAQAGKCPFVHDPAAVAVCQRWLLGACTAGDTCPLQHRRVPDLMPTCSHFLRGACSNADCPYLHVNLGPEAPYCQDFLAGHCEKGAACTARHFTARMVKEFDKARAAETAATKRR